MKNTLPFATFVTIAFASCATSAEKKSAKAPPPPTVVTAPAAPAPSGSATTYEYDQKPAAGRQPLVTADQAQAIIDRFKSVYPKLGNPRVVIYVNRELIDDAGLKLIARTEKVNTTTEETKGEGQGAPNTTTTTEKAQRENRYRRDERKELSLSDRQTVRDVERLLGRPLRTAGVRLADQRIATQLIADRPLKSLNTEGEQAHKDREALGRIAEVAIEILISSKKIDVTELSGNRTYEVPDIQVTAMNLKDAAILGQASSADVLRGNPSYYARNHDVREITEAVALALMEDISSSVGGTADAK